MLTRATVAMALLRRIRRLSREGEARGTRQRDEAGRPPRVGAQCKSEQRAVPALAPGEQPRAGLPGLSRCRVLPKTRRARDAYFATGILCVGLAALSCACSPSTTTAVSPILPLRTLRLYETGVGYFERSGTVGTPTSLPVPAGHLDDALETLVVLGEGGKSRVRGIEFGSSISRGMARALAGLPVEGDEPLGLQQILTGLKGAAVEVRARGTTNTGRIVDVVQATADGVAGKDAAPTEVQGDSKPGHDKITALTLLVLTDRGAIVRVPVADVDAVRPLDPGYAARLGSALDALSTRGAQSERMLHVLSGGGPVTLGYVAETPVWRTTYRLVLDGDGHSAVLEGWALLHNDTDEDWRGVHVELANGRPDSFLFPLAAPRYARRQLVTPDDQLATVPQLMGTTVDAIWGDQTGDSFGAGGLGLTGTGEGGGGRGEGIGLGSIGSIGHGSGGGGGSSLLEVGNLASVAPAEGAEAGALFVYTLPDAWICMPTARRSCLSSSSGSMRAPSPGSTRRDLRHAAPCAS